MRKENEREACLLIIQCDFGHVDGDLIACARYHIYDMRAKALLQFSSGLSHTTHVLFIIHLPVQAVQSSFVGFQGDPWVSCHIDELRRSNRGDLTFEMTQGATISEIFYGKARRNQPFLPGIKRKVAESRKKTEKKREDMEIEEEGKEEIVGVSGSRERTEQDQMMQSKQDNEVEEQEEVIEESEEDDEHDVEREGPVRTTSDWEREEEVARQMFMQCTRLNSCIQAAASRLQDSTQNKHRATQRVELLIDLIPQTSSYPLGEWPHSPGFACGCSYANTILPTVCIYFLSLFHF